MGKGNKLKLAFIGSGRAATTLAITVHKLGHCVSEILSRNEKTGRTLAKRVGAQYRPWPNKPGRADLLFVCVSDDAIKSVAGQIRTDAVVVHCSGSINMQVLHGSSNRIGILYPIQTMRKDGSLPLDMASICIEGNAPEVVVMLRHLAERFGKQVFSLDSEQRRKAHLAAVFANNFSYHLFGMARDYLHAEGLPEALLNPLIASTCAQATDTPPFVAQTGPAARGDESVMREHLKMLEKNREMTKIYTLVSESIRKRHGQENS